MSLLRQWTGEDRGRGSGSVYWDEIGHLDLASPSESLCVVCQVDAARNKPTAEGPLFIVF